MPNAWQLHGNCMASAWQLHGKSGGFGKSPKRDRSLDENAPVSSTENQFINEDLSEKKLISKIECKNVGFVYIHNVNVRSAKNQFINEDLSEKMLISEIECKNVGFVNIDAGVSTDLFFVASASENEGSEGTKSISETLNGNKIN